MAEGSVAPRQIRQFKSKHEEESEEDGLNWKEERLIKMHFLHNLL